MQQENIYKVGANSNPGKVAGAIAKSVRKGESVSIRAIGLLAFGMTAKSVAIANEYLKEEQTELCLIPVLPNYQSHGIEKRIITFNILELKQRN